MRIMILKYVPDETRTTTSTVVVDREDRGGGHLFHVKKNGERLSSHFTSSEAAHVALDMVLK